MTARRVLSREAYKIGEAYDFRVRLQFGNFCEVVDESTGITAFLHNTDKLKTKLFKNQVVRCTVTGIEDKHPRIEITDADNSMSASLRLTEEKLTALLDSQQIQWNTREFVRLLTNDEKDKDFETLCFRWIQGLLNKKTDLHIVCDDCRNLLEMSDLLNMCGDVEREYYESRLTVIIDQLDCYTRAEEYIAADDSDKFIDGLFTKLRTSGFVYHPETNFNILSSMFLMKPDLMNVRMAELISIIGEKEVRTWSKEPFRSALVKLLELYIRERENHLGTAQVSEQAIKQDIHAIALQLLLLGRSSNMGITDFQLNKARLCYACSFENTVAPEKLVDAAYLHLFHSSAKLPGYKMDSLQLLPYHIGNMPSVEIDTINSYTQSQCRLTITPEGICLSPTGISKELYPVFPKSMQLWKNFQVMLPYRLDYDLSDGNWKFRQLQDTWHDIEAELFNRKISLSTKAMKTVRHDIGDIVTISITGQDDQHKGVYYCQVEDGTGGEGFIHIKDIVPYTIVPTLRHFIGTDGNRMAFTATVIGENDGYYRFSMRNGLSDFYRNYYDTDEEVICSIGGKVNANGLAPAISEDGISISLINAREFPYVKKGTIVVCRIVGPGRGEFPYRAEIIEKSLESYDLFVSFKRLMKQYSSGTVTEVITQQEEEQIQDSDRILDESYVREVIRLVDRMSTLESDYFKSYSYLGFARMLAMLIGWEEQTAYYKGRMDIIAMLHYFAVNSRVEEEDIAQLEQTNAELYSSYPFLSEKFRQLQAVSYMGKSEHNRELLDLAEGSILMKQLSQLVLAYNITKDNGMKTTSFDIQNRIRQLLNLKGTESGLKLYGGGEEDEETEYKTSLVYTAGSHTANPERQMDEILRNIDSLLNTRGGTLYVGVSDTGHGVGLEQDLESSYYNGDRDKVLRSIPDAMSLKWGNGIVSTYIESIGFDQDNDNKTILIVRIKPHPTGVPFEGVYYVRVGSTKRKLTKEEYDEYRRINRSAVIESVPVEVTEEEPEISEDIPVPAPFISSKEADILTSRQRKNVLAEYMDPENYEEPIAFFKFLGDAKFQKTDYYDYDDQSLLTLAVKESEKDGYLVLAYANGHIVKVPVAQLLKCGNGSYSRYSESRLMFASIAGKGDAILNIIKDNKTRSQTLMRLDRLRNYPEGRITDSGTVVYKESLLGRPIDFEIINENDLGFYTTIIDMPPKHLGWNVNETTKPIVTQLTQLGVTGLS